MNYNKDNRLESQSSKKRYMVGKDRETAIISSLKKHGLVLEEASKKQDCDNKIDCFLCENGQKKACQVKARMSYSGDDILIDLFEPYFGVDSKETKKGRDYVGQYEVYICLSKNGEQIRVIDGVRQKEIVEEVLVEWKSKNYQLPVFNSKKYEGIQLRYLLDKYNGNPKILMFIPVNVYKEKEIKYYSMN